MTPAAAPTGDKITGEKSSGVISVIGNGRAISGYLPGFRQPGLGG